MSELTAADQISNRATQKKRQRGPGDAALSALMWAHGLVMNGGVLHCVETLSDQELREALAGYRYSELRSPYEGIADDGQLMAAFKAHYAEHSEAYEPVSLPSTGRGPQ